MVAQWLLNLVISEAIFALQLYFIYVAFVFAISFIIVEHKSISWRYSFAPPSNLLEQMAIFSLIILFCKSEKSSLSITLSCNWLISCAAEKPSLVKSFTYDSKSSNEFFRHTSKHLSIHWSGTTPAISHISFLLIFDSPSSAVDAWLKKWLKNIH